MEMVSLKGLRFSYPTRTESLFNVFSDLNLSVGKGEVVGLIGRNASGKTTLLNVIRGTLIPQKGEVKIADTLVSRHGKRCKRPVVSIISQRPDAGLAPTMTVYENYIFAKEHKLSLNWAYTSRRRKACMKLLAKAKMGLEGKIDEQVRFLSGGQQQALSILLELEFPNPLLLMDEPTAALDPYVATEVLDLALKELASKNGTIIFVSHRLRDILERCQRIIVLGNCNIIHDIKEDINKISEKDILGMMGD